MTSKNEIIISIVTVCFNAEDVIENTIKSVLSQTYTAIEYVIIDGKSSDNTMSIIERYRNKIARVISEKDIGIYDAMNKSLEFVTGDFVYFLNADDCLIANYTIEGVVNAIRDRDTVYYGNVLLLDELQAKTTLYDGPFNKFKICIKNICHQSIFYPKSIYTIYRYDLKYKILADYLYNIILFSDKKRFQYLDAIIASFALGGVSSTAEDIMMKQNRGLIIRKKLGYGYFVYYLLKKYSPIYFLKKKYCQYFKNGL